jgi:hypothetical protein
MIGSIVVLAVLLAVPPPVVPLGLAPARVAPATPPASPAPDPAVAFPEPKCLTVASDPKLRLKCYRAVLQAHLHHWGDVGDAEDDLDRAVLDWHADAAWDVYVESASYVAAKEGLYTRTEISQYMYLASLVIMTDVYAEFYRTDPRVKKICVAADAALKLAWQKTYCASGTDEPAASAVPGASREDAAERFRAACGKELPDTGIAPVRCKGVGEERAAVSALAKVLLDKEREAREIAALAPDGSFAASRELSSWKTELVELSTTLEQEIAAGTFDPKQHAARVEAYRASTELPGVVAVEEAKVEAVEGLYGALGVEPPADVSKLRRLTSKPPSARELCGPGAASCKKFEGALEGYYGKLDRHDWKAGTEEKANAVGTLQRQTKTKGPPPPSPKPSEPPIRPR